MTEPLTAPHPLPEKHRHHAFGTYLVMALILAVAWSHILLAAHAVSGVSMQRTILNGQVVISSRLGAWMGGIHRGDIVIVHNPAGADVLIKRVIGIPGDQIVIQGKNVTLNGQLLREPYIGSSGSFLPETWTLGPEQYFVMGDNRLQSCDSRVFGPVSASDIEERVIAIISPWSERAWLWNGSWSGSTAQQPVKQAVPSPRFHAGMCP